jgi:hypothetical protein
MGKKRKSATRTAFLERESRIHTADELASQAEKFARIAVTESSETAWRDAATHYRRAALLYRQAGLGLLAKSQWQSCVHCAEALGDTEAVATCRREAEVIPAYWEGEK